LAHLMLIVKRSSGYLSEGTIRNVCPALLPSVDKPRSVLTEGVVARRIQKLLGLPQASEVPQEYESILLAVSAALFAWIMRAVLDIYFVAESSGTASSLLGIPARELYSRVALAAAFLMSGIIIYLAVKKLKKSEARARRLDQCVRSVRAINQLITRVKDRDSLCQQACDELVRGLGYCRVRARLDGITLGYAELPDNDDAVASAPNAVAHSIPIKCAGEKHGELCVTSCPDRALDREEMALLEEVAEDIAFSLRSMAISKHLLQQREELQTILDSASAYITYQDRDGRYIQVNRAIADVAGLERHRWVGRKFEELFPGADGLGNYADEEVLTTGTPKHSVLEALELPSETRWVQSDRIPYKDGSGSTVGVITLSVDVTERMQAERELCCKEEQLRQSQKMEAIGRLAGGVAHDFNNLLTAISGYTELARAKLEPNEQVSEMLASVSKAADRAAALTKQLLAFSRKQPLWLADQDLNAVITSTTDILGRVMGEDIELVTQLGDDVGSIEADASQMEQVLMNLAVNARDAMPHGGRFTISTAMARPDELRGLRGRDPDQGTTADRWVRLRVSDNGMGMDDKTLSKVFEPFFTTKRPGVGTGLGLSVVDGIIEQHGGWLEVESEIGKGTTFTIYLPQAKHCEPRECESVERETSQESPAASGERVLLVEDEDGVRAFAGRALREWGYDIVEADSAEEALEILESDNTGFDLVFSDIVLPGRSGTQLAEELAARRPGLRVLLTSGYLFPEGNGDSEQVVDFEFPLLRKPYSVRGLRSAIRGALQ
jgi:two-component system cell cycle sensor histidine kinase/response regulator CckA